MSKKRSNSNGIVFSTNPDFPLTDNNEGNAATLAPSKQPLKVRIESKQRRGKSVTLVEGFVGKEEDLEDLGKKIKTFCGTGGTVKDRQIVIQGDQRDRVMQWLNKNGFTMCKSI
jgi:translation initiation factor 1